MLLDTKAAKIILWSMIFCFSLLGIFVVVTAAGEGTSSTSAAQENVAEAIDITPTPDSYPAVIVPPTPQPALKPVETEGDTRTTPPRPVSSGIVYIDPANSQVSPCEEVTLAVEAEIDGAGISGSEIILRYDSVMFQIVSIDTEDVLGGNPLVGIKEIDSENGLLKYAIARRGQTEITGKASETIARIKFAVTDLAPEGTSRFTLSQVKLTDDEFRTITDVKVQNGTLTIIE